MSCFYFHAFCQDTNGQNKKNDPEEQPSQHEDKLTNIPNNQSFFKKWIKKIL